MFKGTSKTGFIGGGGGGGGGGVTQFEIAKWHLILGGYFHIFMTGCAVGTLLTHPIRILKGPHLETLPIRKI